MHEPLHTIFRDWKSNIMRDGDVRSHRVSPSLSTNRPFQPCFSNMTCLFEPLLLVAATSELFSLPEKKARFYICIILVSNGKWYFKRSLSYFMCKTRRTVEMEVSLSVYRNTENICSVSSSLLQGTPNSKNVCFNFMSPIPKCLQYKLR